MPGFHNSNQSSPELGFAIHSLIFTAFALPSPTVSGAPPGVGNVSTHGPVPSGTRLMEKSVACKPYVSEFTMFDEALKRNKLAPSPSMLKPVFVLPAGISPSQRMRNLPCPAMTVPGPKTYL